MGTVTWNLLRPAVLVGVLILGGVVPVWGITDTWLLYVDTDILRDIPQDRGAAELLDLLPAQVAATKLQTLTVREAADLLSKLPAEKASEILEEINGPNAGLILRALITKTFPVTPPKSAYYFGYITADKPASVCQIFNTLKTKVEKLNNNTTTYKPLAGCLESDESEKPTTTYHHGTPVVNEKHNTFVLYVFEKNTAALGCHKVDTEYTPVDARIAPTTKIAKAARLFEDVKGAEPKELFFFLCDLNTLGKGATRISFTVGTPTAWDATSGQPEIKIPTFQGAVDVHALYRFRITGGPVWSSLIRKNRVYRVQTNSSGTKVITSDTRNESPVNYVIFLKTYLALDGRDFLVDPPTYWSLERFSISMGVNLLDRPVDNFYLGLGYEPLLGIDFIVGGHFAKLTQLNGGFAGGQTVLNDTLSTKKLFQTGYFAGIMVDVGVIGAWLGNSVFTLIDRAFGRNITTRGY